MNDNDFQELKDDVATIKRAVVGDDQLEQPGLMHRVKDLESWRAWLMLKLAVVAGGFAVACWLAKLAFGH